MKQAMRLCTLQIGIGKCNLKVNRQGLLSVSLEMGQYASQSSPRKRILNNTVSFNTTLRMNIDKDLLQQQTNQQCRILLHLMGDNRQKQVIGVATVDINAENNQGFKYYKFAECVDQCEGDIEIAVNCLDSFQRQVKSDVGYVVTSESRLYEENYLDSQRGRDFQDSILDDSELNVMNRSKAVSNIDWTSVNRPKQSSINFKLKRSSNSKLLRKPKPQNLSSCAPQQIITHYETQIKTFQDQLRSRDQWANGMKLMIQQLEAENQLLKEIKIEQLQSNNIQNLSQGIQYVSKLVHSKFQASKSMIYDSQNDISLDTTSRQRIDEQLKLELKGPITESNLQDTERQIAEQRQIEQIPKIIISPRMGSPLKRKSIGRGEVVQSKQQLQNAFTILTGLQNNHKVISPQQNQRINQLQQSLLKIRSQKQQLEEMTQQLYEQLTTTKSERDSFYDEIQLLGKQLQQITKTMEDLKQENEQLKNTCKGYEMSLPQEDFDNFVKENNRLEQMNLELQRKLKQSLKAIQEFKNDALSARSEIIMKENELNLYKMKFGQLGEMTEVILNQDKINQQNLDRSQKKLFSFKDTIAITTNQTCESTSTLHSIYLQLLESSIIQRKQLQKSLLQISTHKDTIPQSNYSKSNLKKVQLQINKLFIEIFKNNSSLKNVKEIETIKKQLSTQIDTIISNF